MEYLNKVLGIRVVYKDGNMLSLPNYIYSRYRLQEVMLDGVKAVFVYPKEELESVNAVKKHLDRVEKAFDAPVILVTDRLTFRQKEYLLRDRIPFIVDGKQIYLPFMAVYLQDRCDAEKKDIEMILPSSQMLFLHFIYSGGGELLTSMAAKELFLTATSVSRASRQLEEMGLLKTEIRGVQKVIFSHKTPEELFESAKPHLLNPVKRTVYLPRSVIREKLLLSGYHALSEYSMLDPGNIEYFASGSISEWERYASGRIVDPDEECAVELWRYDPGILSKGKCVDRLSLALSLDNDGDERVEQAVEEMLKNLWGELDGKRDRKF